MDLPLIDLARHLPDDPNPPPELWPAVPQPNAVHQTGTGLTAFASHSHYAVSYTHLDVYKRQKVDRPTSNNCR